MAKFTAVLLFALFAIATAASEEKAVEKKEGDLQTASSFIGGYGYGFPYGGYGYGYGLPYHGYGYGYGYPYSYGYGYKTFGYGYPFYGGYGGFYG